MSCQDLTGFKEKPGTEEFICYTSTAFKSSRVLKQNFVSFCINNIISWWEFRKLQDNNDYSVKIWQVQPKKLTPQSRYGLSNKQTASSRWSSAISLATIWKQILTNLFHFWWELGIESKMSKRSRSLAWTQANVLFVNFFSLQYGTSAGVCYPVIW